MPFDLEDLQNHNSELLKLLTQNLPDMLWVKDLNGDYIYANKALCDGLLMAKDINEPIGKGDVFFALRERKRYSDKSDWHTFGELCFNSDQEVIDHNKAMKFEEYGNVKGKLLYLEVYKAPFYDEEGNIIGTVGAGRDITKLKHIQHKLAFQAQHDTLTKLPNRTALMEQLEVAIDKHTLSEHSFAVLFLDLNDFKEINDSLGHRVGDDILIAVAKKIHSKLRRADSIARLGGDEFCIILNDVRREDIAPIIIEGLTLFDEPCIIGNNTLHISMSVGVAMYPDDGRNADELLKNADAAMYQAKREEKHSFSFYSKEMTYQSIERLYLESELKKAFEEDQLHVYFQAQVNARTEQLIGMETLVRWEHPDMGFVFPDKFIPLAENNGMIVELDRIVMRKALEQCQKWMKEGLFIGKLSLNLSMKQLEDEDFLNFIQALAKEYSCAFSDLEFEVTETQLMKNPDESIKALILLHELGASIAIDDFGTGYSSLSYLKKMPIDRLKIDKSFVDGLPEDNEDISISKTIIALCKSLDLNVIAEGVETQAQRKFLLENGCEDIQGYLYSKPLSIDDMSKYLKRGK